MPVTMRRVGDVDALELHEQGDGPPLLFLHGIRGLDHHGAVLDGLARDFRVLAPSHPGFGRSALPDWCDTVDDLVCVYLELIDDLGLRDLAVVGCSLGGWIAAELALRAPLAQLVLVDAVGIRVGGREERDIADIYALSAAEVARLAFSNPDLAAGFASIEGKSQEELAIIARNQDAGVLYGWEPYFCNPKLLRRLRRVTAPTLVVWGADDGIVTTDYGRAYAAAIPGARFQAIAAAGHAPQLEQPEAFLAVVRDFLGTAPGAPAR